MSRRSIEFTKMHGAGNDFVVLDGIRDALPRDLPGFSRRVSERSFGGGADQILVVREVHRTHTAGSNRPFDAVLTDALRASFADPLLVLCCKLLGIGRSLNGLRLVAIGLVGVRRLLFV